MSLNSSDDALSIIFSGLRGCVVREKDVSKDFFDLKNGLAGEILQKFVNYKFRVAIIVPAIHGHGERVTELIRDHQSHPYVRFFTIEQDAQKWAEGR